MRKAMKGLLRKRLLFATLLALTIFGAVYGFAATLNVNANNLSAGNAAVASCETSTPVGTYAIAYDPAVGASGGYKVSSVTVTGIDAGCSGKTVSVTLTGAANASLATGSTTIGGTSATISSLTGTAPASDVTGVQVAING